MSADSVHAVVERQIKTRKNIYEFDNFAKCVTSSDLSLQNGLHGFVFNVVLSL